MLVCHLRDVNTLEVSVKTFFYETNSFKITFQGKCVFCFMLFQHSFCEHKNHSR